MPQKFDLPKPAGLPPIPKNWIEIATLEDVVHLREDLEECKRVAFDTETTGLTIADEIFGVVFGVGDRVSPDFPKGDKLLQRCYWFDFYESKNKAVADAVIQVVRDLFTTDRWNVIFHNAAFDIKMVKCTWDIDFTHDNLNDTQLLALVLNKWIEVKLKTLTRHLLQRPTPWDEMVKSVFKKFGLNPDSKDTVLPYDMLPTWVVFPYACEDSANTFDLFFELLTFYKFELPELQEIYKLERCVANINARMQFHGMNVDVDYLKTLRARIQEEYEVDTAEFSGLWGTYRNSKKRTVSAVESSTKLGLICFDPLYPNGLKLDPMKARTTPKGAYSVGMDYLHREFCDDPITQRLPDDRTFTKNPMVERIDMFMFRQAVAEKIDEILRNMMIHTDDDGNELYTTIHTNYWQIADTGRFRSSKVNLQNIKNDKLSYGIQPEYSVRGGFVAPEGYLYVTSDFKSFEVAILANASQDEKLVRDVLEGEDFHSRIGSIAYHRPYDELRKKVDRAAIYQRTQIKKTSFLFIYGGGKQKAVDVNGVTMEEARAIEQSIERAYPYMCEWRRRVTDQVSRDKKVHTLCGRMRRIPSDKAYTQGVNMICQGTAADVMKYAHLEIERLLTGRKSRQAATIHDEIHLYLHPEDWEIVPQLVEVMERPRFEPPNHGARVLVPLTTEWSMSEGSWGQMKECTIRDIQDKLVSMR